MHIFTYFRLCLTHFEYILLCSIDILRLTCHPVVTLKKKKNIEWGMGNGEWGLVGQNRSSIVSYITQISSKLNSKTPVIKMEWKIKKPSNETFPLGFPLMSIVLHHQHVH